MFKKKFSLVKRVKKIICCGLFLVFLGSLGSQPLHSSNQCCELWVSLKSGATLPWDWALGKILQLKLCPNAIVDFEFRCGKWGFVVDVAYNRFRLVESDEYSDWWSVNTSGHYYFGKAKIRPFVYFGPGMYFPEFGDYRIGIRGGLGVQIPINERVYFSLGTDFQHVFLKDDDLSFQHFHAGVDIKVK